MADTKRKNESGLNAIHSVPLSDIDTDPIASYNVVGVTFDNDDGSSRQEAIKAFDENGIGDVEFETYEYDGEPAVRVILNGTQVGNIAKDEVEDFLDDCQQTNRVTFESSSFVNEKDEKIYTAEVTLEEPDEDYVPQSKTPMTEEDFYKIHGHKKIAFYSVAMLVIGILLLLCGLLITFAISKIGLLFVAFGVILIYVSRKYKKINKMYNKG